MKNKVSISMVSLFCLMLAGGAYASNKSVAEGGYWSQVDALTTNDKLMEIAYDDTLSDGKAKAKDKALSAMKDAINAQQKLDSSVKGVKEAKAAEEDKLKHYTDPKDKYREGTMSDEELAAYIGQQSRYADLEMMSIFERDASKRAQAVKELEEAKKQGLYDEDLVKKIREMPYDGWGGRTQKLMDEYNKRWGYEDDRLNKDNYFDKREAEMIDWLKDGYKNDIYEKNEAMVEAMTPEVRNAIREELGVADGAALNNALNDAESRKALQDRLDNISSSYSDFPKINVNTEEGQNFLHSMVGVTNTGDLGTVKSDGSSITVQTTEEAERAAREALDNPVYNPGSGYTDSLDNSSNATPGLGNDATVE